MCDTHALMRDPEAIEIIEGALIAGKKAKAINELLVAAGKPTCSKENIRRHWTTRPRVVEGMKAAKERLIRRGYGDRLKRVRRLENLLGRCLQIIEGRAEEMTGLVAGGESGLLAEDVKQIGAGEFAETVKVYRFDAALHREIREALKQISIEVGDWTEKRDLTSDGEAVKAYIGVAIDDV
jgi:hypothetical protein